MSVHDMSESSANQLSLEALANGRPAVSQTLQLFRRSRPRSFPVFHRQHQENARQANLGVQRGTPMKVSGGSSNSSKSTQHTAAHGAAPSMKITEAAESQQQLRAQLYQHDHRQNQQQQGGNDGCYQEHTLHAAPQTAGAALAVPGMCSVAQQLPQQQQQALLPQQQHLGEQLQQSLQTINISLQQQQQQQLLLRDDSLQSTQTAVSAALHAAFDTTAAGGSPTLAAAAVFTRQMISLGARHISNEFAAQLKDQVLDRVVQASAAAEAAGRQFVPEEVLVKMIPDMKAAVMKAWNEKKAHTRQAQDACEHSPEQQYRLAALKAALAVKAAASTANGATAASLQSQQTDEQDEHSTTNILSLLHNRK